MVDNYTTIEPQAVGGFKKSFEEQGQTHEKALRTPNSTLFEKMQNETTRHKGKQEETQAGRQAGKQDRRQDLGKADTPSSTKADTLRKQ